MVGPWFLQTERFQPPNLALLLVRIEHSVKARADIFIVDSTWYFVLQYPQFALLQRGRVLE
jgi:hypothetical protein